MQSGCNQVSTPCEGRCHLVMNYPSVIGLSVKQILVLCHQNKRTFIVVKNIFSFNCFHSILYYFSTLTRLVFLSRNIYPQKRTFFTAVKPPKQSQSSPSRSKMFPSSLWMWEDREHKDKSGFSALKVSPPSSFSPLRQNLISGSQRTG